MLGDSLLVAPVFSEEGEVEYYLPGGIWTNLLTYEKKKEEDGYRENMIILVSLSYGQTP